MRTLRLVAASMVALIAGVSIAYSYGDNQMTWYFHNHSGGKDIDIEFTTTNHIWPGDNEAYALPANERTDITLNCFSGQRICYGAWDKYDHRYYWGMGINRRHSCASCCYICGESNPNIDLNP